MLHEIIQQINLMISREIFTSEFSLQPLSTLQKVNRAVVFIANGFLMNTIFYEKFGLNKQHVLGLR